ncbi:uncharacterized protein LOC115896476 [Rhinopithecus roxellana]|uniref:uncharacterized protein LOC115896476 n=1 Tax=Rhinopithecus roxellana TaxID=61622 RepID=UPI0012371D5D|nr:uncharacterized protein LOC115896476 [Rhinopithecus roxellana]
MQCQLFRTETSKAVSELNYDYICIKAGTGRPLAERAALEQYRRDILHINLLIWNHFDSKGQRKITASLLEGKRTGDLVKTQLHLEQGLFPALQSQLCRASGPESSQKPKGRHGSKRLSAAAFGAYVRMETSKEARLLELLPPLLGDNIDYPG